MAAEAPQIHRDADGILWRRTGSCSGCGECCSSGDPFNGERGVGEVPGACPLLTAAHRCAGHGSDPYYLAGCVVFPQFPAQVAAYPSCSYVFERLEG